ncbi:hypothetical protein ACFV6G_26355 [Streptomyces lavendulae]|uniref:hypothetical protein n=1 Tax=Streptomyces lavendulae TaxID=1914 RepID=UPI003697A30A
MRSRRPRGPADCRPTVPAGAEALARQAADHGAGYALFRLVELRENAGDQAGAEALLRQAVDHGSVEALSYLAVLREKAGNQAGAEALVRQAVDHGNSDGVYLAGLRISPNQLWPNGLDPDGTPTAPWM